MKLRFGHKIALLSLVPIIGFVLILTATNSRPERLSIDIYSDPAHPSVKRAVLNNFAILESSISGSSQTGGPYYQNPINANLAFQIMWYDILAKTFYERRFDLDARNLSTFGENGIHASVYITLGPGADVTVTTPHPEGLRLVGLNRMDEITPDMDVPVTLLELCADQTDDDPSEDGILMTAMSDKNSLEREMHKRDIRLKTGKVAISRCIEVATK